MKKLLMLTTILSLPMAFAQEVNCASPSVKYRKANTGIYGDSIGHSLACQAAVSGKRASRTNYDPRVIKCEEATVLYNEKGGNKYAVSCAKLVYKATGKTKYLEVTNGLSASYKVIK